MNKKIYNAPKAKFHKLNSSYKLLITSGDIESLSEERVEEYTGDNENVRRVWGVQW